MAKIVYAMQTTSGTFLANNMNHHNCNRLLNGNYESYNKVMKKLYGEDNCQKLWDKAYSGKKIPTCELEEMLVEIKQKYKDLIRERKEKGYKC